MLTNLYIFGDSIIDNGNSAAYGNPPSGTAVLQPYFSNGIPFADLMCNYLGIPSKPRVGSPGSVVNHSLATKSGFGNNYACSGAHMVDTGANSGPFLTPSGHSCDNQSQLFSQDYAGVAPDNSGALVFIGTNDVQSLEDVPTNMGQLAIILNRLISCNLPNIIVVNYPIRGGIAAQSGAQLTNAIAWNAAIAALVKTIPGCVLFDIAALWVQIIATPQAYGVGITDISIADAGSVVGLPEDYLYWSQNTHYSAAGHRIVANAIMPVFAKTFYNNYSQADYSQTALATSIIGTINPNPTIPIGYTPSTQLVAQSDHRLSMGQQAVVTPQMGMRWSSDFESGTATPAPYTWVQTKTGSGGWLYTSTFTNTHGSVNMFTSAAADVTGQTIPVPYIMQPNTGKLDMSFRTGGWSLTTNDQITVQWGLVDSISAPANGMFFNLNNNAGVITASFVALKAGASANPISFTMPASPPPCTLRVITDHRWQRASIYINNVQVATSSGLFTPPTVTTMYPGFVTTKIGAVAGVSYLNLDLFNIAYFWDRS